jgi:hypothetical protein
MMFELVYKLTFFVVLQYDVGIGVQVNIFCRTSGFIVHGGQGVPTPRPPTLRERHV